MRRLACLVTISLALPVLLRGLAGAHDTRIPIGGKKVQVKTGDPAKKKFTFSAKDELVVAAHDPAADGMAILVSATGVNGGRTPLIELDPALWKGRGNPPGSKGYQYADKLGSRGGVIKVKYAGGKLLLKAKGADWPWDPAGSVDEVWVHVRVEDEWYCARFGGDVKANEAHRFIAKNALAPADCPAQLCGNGVTEVGEECDDGNLDDTDGCANTCVGGTCAGQAFDSTWEAIQQRIFSDGGCTNAICHGGSPPAGNLDLTPLNAHAQLVNVPSSISPLDRVEPGDQDLSFLYLKLAAATLPAEYPPASIPGTPMPAGGFPPIPTDHLEALRLWIRAGAPETGVVADTAQLLGSCLPPPTPQKIPPLDPPPAGTGVQLYAPPWPLAPQSEREVCYAVYYDFTGIVPPSALAPCPPFMGGAGELCIRYHATTLAQDPQSHHSIIRVYRGVYDTTDPGWGAWTCKGGANDGLPCEPTGIGVAAPAGADCGPQSGCSSQVKNAVACIGFGPPDYGFASNVAPSIGGSQEALSSQTFAAGVYSVIPLRAIAVFNSHAFNLTSVPTTMEQYFNLLFAAPGDQLYQAIGVFDDTDIFVQNVPPFEQREYCRTFTFPQNARLFDLSSHVHKRGILFRIWGPPQATACSSATGTCLPDAGSPLYISTEYNDPVRLEFDPPIHLSSSTAANRRYKFCARYDNGFLDQSTVKRRSTSPVPVLPFAPGGPCAVSETRCIGGPNHNQPCNGTHAFCDSSPGAGDGDCDACPLRGGVTTEDEMFILLGTYYIAP